MTVPTVRGLVVGRARGQQVVAQHVLDRDRVRHEAEVLEERD